MIRHLDIRAYALAAVLLAGSVAGALVTTAHGGATAERDAEHVVGRYVAAVSAGDAAGACRLLVAGRSRRAACARALRPELRFHRADPLARRGTTVASSVSTSIGGLHRVAVRLAYRVRGRRAASRDTFWVRGNGPGATIVRGGRFRYEAVGEQPPLSAQLAPLSPAQAAADLAPGPQLRCPAGTHHVALPMGGVRRGLLDSTPVHAPWLDLVGLDVAAAPDGGGCLVVATAGPVRAATELHLTVSQSGADGTVVVADITWGYAADGAPLAHGADGRSVRVGAVGARPALAFGADLRLDQPFKLSLSTVSTQPDEPLLPHPVAGGDDAVEAGSIDATSPAPH